MCNSMAPLHNTVRSATVAKMSQTNGLVLSAATDNRQSQTNGRNRKVRSRAIQLCTKESQTRASIELRRAAISAYQQTHWSGDPFLPRCNEVACFHFFAPFFPDCLTISRIGRASVPHQCSATSALHWTQRTRGGLERWKHAAHCMHLLSLLHLRTFSHA